jgi:hypothetical protein
MSAMWDRPGALESGTMMSHVCKAVRQNYYVRTLMFEPRRGEHWGFAARRGRIYSFSHARWPSLFITTVLFLHF